MLTTETTTSRLKETSLRTLLPYGASKASRCELSCQLDKHSVFPKVSHSAIGHAWLKEKSTTCAAL